MEQIEYIYQCVAQALAMEEEDIVPRSVRRANLRYIKRQLATMVSERTIQRAEETAIALVENIKARK